ncbi:hypothetical protein ACHAQJ_001258 [Trichoderma viride]
MGGFFPPGPPVPDDLKPDLPYIAGATLKIQPCLAHDPFGPSYEGPRARIHRPHVLERYSTPSRWCLENPPLECKPIAGAESLTMIIDSQIACGDGRGAQIVKCRFEGKEKWYVAKIFDPLYYNWDDVDDMAYIADHQFTNEAAAFEILSEMNHPDSFGYPRVQEAVEGFIPTYHGCYTWETHLLDGQRRDVRLIIMEYIPFPSIRSIIEAGEATKIPAETRIQLLAKAMEVDCWLQYYGVNQYDFAMRNILVDPKEGRVVLLDFSHAKIRDFFMSKWFLREGEPVPAGPESPISRFDCAFYDDFPDDWIPENLRTVQARYDWFFNKWGDSTVFEPIDSYWHEHDEPYILEEIEEEKQRIEKKRTRSSESWTDRSSES